VARDRYAPDGSRFLSVGSDQKGVLYDGSTAEVLAELQAGAKAAGHTGSVYSCNWSADGTRVLTASADKTVKLWDVAGAAPTCLTTFVFDAKPQVEHMQVRASASLDPPQPTPPAGSCAHSQPGDPHTIQAASSPQSTKQAPNRRKATSPFPFWPFITALRQVGSFWLGEFMGSVSLTGDINYLDERAGVRPVKVVQGHQKTATAMARAPGGEVYTASYDGVVNRWQPTVAGCTGRVLGKGHGGAGVTGLAPCGDRLLSFGLDDQVQCSAHTPLALALLRTVVQGLRRSPPVLPDSPLPRADAGVAAAGGGVR